MLKVCLFLALISCSPYSSTVGLCPCWWGYCHATLLSPWLLARLPCRAAQSCCFLRRWTLNSCTYTAIDSRNKWKSICCCFWKTKMKRSALQDHSYLILYLAGMVKIEPLFLLFCYTEILCLLRLYNLRSWMAERKLHPEHHSLSKTFLCIICWILIKKSGH